MPAWHRRWQESSNEPEHADTKFSPRHIEHAGALRHKAAIGIVREDLHFRADDLKLPAGR